MDWQLLQLWRAHLAISLRKADVLALGESSYLFVDPSDQDTRKLPEMIVDHVGGGATLVTFRGGGYDPRLYCEVIRLLGGDCGRPRVVVLSLCVRASLATHVQVNPRFSYRRSQEIMACLSRPRPPLATLVVRRDERGADKSFEDERLVTRWTGVTTLGDFRERLRGASTARDGATERLLFDYFHGETVADNAPGLQRWRDLGRLLREFGVPVIAYHAPIPISRGEAHFPGEFREHVRRNQRMLERALSAELGDALHLVEVTELPDSDFIDAGDATEHLNQHGRSKLAHTLAPVIRSVLAGPSPTDVGSQS